MNFIAKSETKTKFLAYNLAEEAMTFKGEASLVIALRGELSAGKTTFAKAFAKYLRIRENITSPTFVIMKIYKIPKNCRTEQIDTFIHIDAYRIKKSKELVVLGIKEILRDKKAIVLIEWADKIKSILPRRNTIWINIRHGKKKNERIFSLHSL